MLKKLLIVSGLSLLLTIIILALAVNSHSAITAFFLSFCGFLGFGSGVIIFFVTR